MDRAIYWKTLWVSGHLIFIPVSYVLLGHCVYIMNVIYNENFEDITKQHVSLFVYNLKHKLLIYEILFNTKSFVQVYDFLGIGTKIYQFARLANMLYIASLAGKA